MEREDCERWLNQWLTNYVRPGPAGEPGEPPLVWYFRHVLAAGDARGPLAEGRVALREILGRPGRYRATAWLRPAFQCEGATTTRLVFDLPGGYQR
jgi:type VI secretion system protein ImpC